MSHVLVLTLNPKLKGFRMNSSTVECLTSSALATRRCRHHRGETAGALREGPPGRRRR